MSILLISLRDFTNWSIFNDFAFSYCFSQSIFLTSPANNFFASDEVFNSESEFVIFGNLGKSTSIFNQSGKVNE